jgi:uncharacterized membrane protein
MTTTSKRRDRTELTSGQIVLALSALLLVVAFFLPWISTGATSPSGLGIASQPTALQPLGIDQLGIATLLYSIPVLAIIALGLAFLRQPIAGFAGVVVSLLAFIVLTALLILVGRSQVVIDVLATDGTFVPFIGVGMWLSLLAAITVSIGSLLAASQYAPSREMLNTRRIVTAGMLGAIAITLSVTQLGFIPVPNVTGRATIMHIPAIIGAVLEGPVVGIVAGGIFGIFSMLNDTTGLFRNPVIAVLPRLMIGLMAWLAYRSLVAINRDFAAAVAGAVGSLTNSILVVGLLVAYGLIPITIVPTIIPQAIMELVTAAIITPIIVRSVMITRSGRTTAEDTIPREKSYY